MCLCTSGVDLIFKEKIRCTEVFYFKGYAAERQRKKNWQNLFLNHLLCLHFSFTSAVWSTKGHLVITFCMRGLQCHICYQSLLHSLQPQLYWSDLGFSSWLQSGQSQSVVWVPLDTAEVFWCLCQYTPTLAICRWAFSPLIPCFFPPFSSTRVLFRLSEMSEQ